MCWNCLSGLTKPFEKRPVKPASLKPVKVRVSSATEEAQARANHPRHDVQRSVLGPTSILLTFYPRL